MSVLLQTCDASRGQLDWASLARKKQFYHIGLAIKGTAGNGLGQSHWKIQPRHPGADGNPPAKSVSDMARLHSPHWIPAYAGMTKMGLGSRLRGNDENGLGFPPTRE